MKREETSKSDVEKSVEIKRTEARAEEHPTRSTGDGSSGNGAGDGRLGARQDVAPVAPEEYKMSQMRLLIVELESIVGRKQNQIDFFQGALQRVAALRESSRADGVKPSTAKSGRSSCKAS